MSLEQSVGQDPSVFVHLDRLFQTLKRRETGLHCLLSVHFPPCCLLVSKWFLTYISGAGAQLPAPSSVSSSLYPTSDPWPMSIPTFEATLGTAEGQVRSIEVTGTENTRVWAVTLRGELQTITGDCNDRCSVGTSGRSMSVRVLH